MSGHKQCSVCEGEEHHWLPHSDPQWTGYVCKHCGARVDDLETDDDSPCCSQCGAQIVLPLSVVGGFAPWLCLECSGASLSDFLDENYPDDGDEPEPSDPNVEISTVCLFPGECLMPGYHFSSECHTGEMAEAYQRDAVEVERDERATVSASCRYCGGAVPMPHSYEPTTGRCRPILNSGSVVPPAKDAG